MVFLCPNFQILNFGTICVEETWFDGDSSTTSPVSSYVLYFAGGHDFLLYEEKRWIVHQNRPLRRTLRGLAPS